MNWRSWKGRHWATRYMADDGQNQSCNGGGLDDSQRQHLLKQENHAASAMNPKLRGLRKRMPNLPPLHFEVQQVEHFGSRK